jgi:hypothetical protein
MNLTPWEDGWVLRPLRFLCRGSDAMETHTNPRSTKKTSDFGTPNEPHPRNHIPRLGAATNADRLLGIRASWLIRILTQAVSVADFREFRRSNNPFFVT